MKTERFSKILTVVFTMLLAGVLLTGGPPVTYAESGDSLIPNKLEESYILGSGDLIQIVVWKNEEVSGSFRIRPDGNFSMPLIGEIIAEGNTTDSVSLQIVEKLKLFIESPFVSTIVVEANSSRIYILGEVSRPGTYPLDGTVTVLQALSMAGGLSTFANAEKMILVRGVGAFQRNIPLSYNKILRTPGEKTNPILLRGDTLVVP